jgi:hypothetical protein
LDRSKKGDPDAVAFLLSQPDVSGDAEEYWAAYQRLHRDRAEVSISAGMGGGVLLPKRVPLPVVRAEGRRLLFAGDDLEDFVFIVSHADDHFFTLETKRIAADVARQAAQAKRGKG